MIQPSFIDSCSGLLFAVYWPPVGQAVSKAILHVPAFAEEMNKSRRMVALQARTLAEQGYAVMVLDLFGTGDSEGDFAEATWSVWLQNIADAIAWLKRQGAQTISLWGLRVGALLAMDFVILHPSEIDKIIAWQPVLNGDLFVTQFLRLRVAAAMMNSAMPQEKISDLKKRLQDGQSLEVAGYSLNPDMIRPMMALKADPLALQSLKAVSIFELVADEQSQLSLANQQFLNTLQTVGKNAFLIKVIGDSFWASQEIATVPGLIEATTERVSQ